MVTESLRQRVVQILTSHFNFLFALYSLRVLSYNDPKSLYFNTGFSAVVTGSLRLRLFHVTYSGLVFTLFFLFKPAMI